VIPAAALDVYKYPQPPPENPSASLSLSISSSLQPPKTLAPAAVFPHRSKAPRDPLSSPRASPPPQEPPRRCMLSGKPPIGGIKPLFSAQSAPCRRPWRHHSASSAPSDHPVVLLVSSRRSSTSPSSPPCPVPPCRRAPASATAPLLGAGASDDHLVAALPPSGSARTRKSHWPGRSPLFTLPRRHRRPADRRPSGQCDPGSLTPLTWPAWQLMWTPWSTSHTPWVSSTPV
jgi:hypothetical protein